ncbi:Rossmann-like and DUF2520 domain-containing protein [Sphingobacterium sp. CZ-2]|uniref:Rossmann-like and DUF2520 domain-containing protein n=1 Tax=Sphingobacterium sp. CZ-2 TaxID=2557994 RepID=UPI00106F64F6|nr:Rossmann-like and DUF2520 domain-containing protein [Sphingobacterium sp. CZ-2]QBR12381.1 DUF2520 domain-containing protein [Sphingobacterium sp. CZ-2]
MKIVLIGSGNIATHLGKAIFATGHHEIMQVYSRTLANAAALANVLSAQAISDLSEISKDANLYLLAVSDSAIPEIVEQLSPAWNGVFVHCSGATDMQVLHTLERYGVIYPVQSFSKEVDLDLSAVPFGIEGSTAEIQQQLMDFVTEISAKVFPCSSEQRLAIHVSAVFANNFSNALFQVAYELLASHQLPFDLIRPIISETAAKVQNHLPEQVQTGPAIRNDKTTMQKHLQFISSNPDWQLIYQKISDLITKTRAKDGEN